MPRTRPIPELGTNRSIASGCGRSAASSCASRSLVQSRAMPSITARTISGDRSAVAGRCASASLRSGSERSRKRAPARPRVRARAAAPCRISASSRAARRVSSSERAVSVSRTGYRTPWAWANEGRAERTPEGSAQPSNAALTSTPCASSRPTRAAPRSRASSPAARRRERGRAGGIRVGASPPRPP